MNLVTVNIIVGIASLIIGYLFGGIPTGVIIGKIFFHIDPRDEGSHNSGGTNVARTISKKIGILVIVLDMLKTLAAVLVVWAILRFTPLWDYMQWGVQVGYTTIGGAKVWYWLCGLGAAIGHCWPIYLRFKGGKAVSCYMGLNTLTSWIQFVLSGFTYLFAAKKSHYISLASMITSIVGTVVAWTIFVLKVTVPFNWDIFMWSFGFGAAEELFVTYGLEYAIANTVIAVLLILRHSANIQRLKNNTESRNPFEKDSK